MEKQKEENQLCFLSPVIDFCNEVVRIYQYIQLARKGDSEKIFGKKRIVNGNVESLLFMSVRKHMVGSTFSLLLNEVFDFSEYKILKAFISHCQKQIPNPFSQ